MSKLTEAAELLDQLPAESRRAITTLIDLKTANCQTKCNTSSKYTS